MSKPKGKDKKNQNISAVQILAEEQKRQILQQTFTIRQLQDRLSRITQQHHSIVNKRDQVQQNYQQQIEKQRVIIETHQTTIKQLRKSLYDMEMFKISLQAQVKSLQRQIKQQQQVRIKQMEEYKRLTLQDINKLESQLKQYTYYMNERDELLEDRKNLNKKLQSEMSQKKRQLADKERDKVQSEDKLRDQMLNKIRDMRSNLLSLKKEQLTTTTRLAVLQNHQLTSQLQFQSKQTQKLLFENEQMQKKISNLKKDLQVHKDVQDQLAKRSHASRAIIKKLTNKIAQLQQQLSTFKNSNKQEIQKNPNPQQTFSKNSVIESLDKSLQQTLKKYTKLQSDQQNIMNQNQYLKSKIDLYEKKSQTILNMVLSYYDQIIQGIIQVKDDQYSYDLKAMRKRKIQQWSKEEIKMVVEVLLNQLAQRLNRKNLGIPTINKNQLIVLDDEDQLLRLPKISDNSSYLKKSEVKPKMQDLPINVASKIVSSNLRQWGRTIHANSVSHISRKFRIYDK